MRTQHPMSFGCFLLVVVFCGAARLATAADKPFGPGDVWSLPETAWRTCLEKNPVAPDCLPRLMNWYQKMRF